MSERDELLAAVLADPDAEAPRLAYASWCDAQGDPRGEFIRLQVEAWHVRRSGPDQRWVELKKEADAILARHEAEWARGVVALASQPRFYRGFVEGVTIDAAAFLRVATQLYAVAPIRHVCFVGGGRVIEELARSPQLGRNTVVDTPLSRSLGPIATARRASPHPVS